MPHVSIPMHMIMSLKKIVPLLAVASCIFSSCLTQEILSPVDPTREYQSDMVSVCKSYLNLSKDDAVQKMKADFKRVPWTNDVTIWVMNTDETIKGHCENDKVYKVSYLRTMSHTQSQMMNAALIISQDVNNFYSIDNPSAYGAGELLFNGDENRTTYTSHSAFISALNSRKNEITFASESWGANTKEWTVKYDSDGSYVEFKLDLGKQ